MLPHSLSIKLYWSKPYIILYFSTLTLPLKLFDKILFYKYANWLTTSFYYTPDWVKILINSFLDYNDYNIVVNI